MLKKRVLTAVLGIIIVFVALAFGAVAWRAVVTVGCLWAMMEFNALAKQKWYTIPSLLGYLVILAFIWKVPAFRLSLVELCVALFLVIPVFLRNRVSIQQTSFMAVGAFYIGFGGLGLSTIRSLPHGLPWIIIFLLAIWTTDTAAYFIGSSIGGPKLWPTVSPNKTVSGAVGGLISAAIVCGVLGVVLINWTNLWIALLVGVSASVVGQLGDLIESAYKRTSGVKDSGRFLPGHGGMLDRVDSLLFAAPVIAWLIPVVVHNIH